MALIQAPHTDSFGKRFGNTFIPQITKGFERYAEEETEKRKQKVKSLAETAKEEREVARQKATAKALGLPEVALEPTVQAALIKEKARDARNKQIMDILGEPSSQGSGSETQPSNESDPSQPRNAQGPRKLNPSQISANQHNEALTSSLLYTPSI